MTNSFDPGLNLHVTDSPLGFVYGQGCIGPQVERRKLDEIRQSLRDPDAQGPQVVYAIAMDVRRPEDDAQLHRQNLLFGVVAYAAGRLGDEPVRSQGHIHKPSPSNGWSTPEVYEIWQGKAVILMQERCVVDDPNPGRCFAVQADPGQVVIVPPNWAHATLSADPDRPLVFGAWCDRDYGFLYDGVRAHHGLAWFPRLDAQNQLHFEPNPTYQTTSLTRKAPRAYTELHLEAGVPIYRQYLDDPQRFMYVPQPARAAAHWPNFIP